MEKLFFDFKCNHLPKKYKKIGILFGFPCEILVCKNCKNNSDLQDFQEEVLQK